MVPVPNQNYSTAAGNEADKTDEVGSTLKVVISPIEREEESGPANFGENLREV